MKRHRNPTLICMPAGLHDMENSLGRGNERDEVHWKPAARNNWINNEINHEIENDEMAGH